MIKVLTIRELTTSLVFNNWGTEFIHFRIFFVHDSTRKDGCFIINLFLHEKRCCGYSLEATVVPSANIKYNTGADNPMK